jgi:hypothetical protein
MMKCRKFDDVVWALDGNAGIAKILGISPSAVSIWRASGRFPSKHYALLAMALYSRGYHAPWSLFHFKGICDEAAA